MDMSCGHLILGRYWQWYRKLIHDGFTNKYLVHHEGKNYDLQPLVKNQEDPLLMCFVSEIIKDDQYDIGWKKGTKIQSRGYYNIPKDGEVSNLTFVQIGTIKCPLIDSKNKNGLEMMNQKFCPRKRSKMKDLETYYCPSQGQSTISSFSFDKLCVNVDWKDVRKKVTLGDYFTNNL